jgi:membrane-associated phospholipid phosphatase
MKNGNILWVVGCAVLFFILTIVGIYVADQSVLEAVRAGYGAGLTDLARFFSRYGDFPFLLGGGIVALGVALRMKRRDWVRILVAMILSGVLAGLITNATKLATGRVRPRVENVEHGWYGPKNGGEWVSLRHDFQAFPSSHSSCAFGFFFPLFFSRRLAGSAGLGVAVLTAWSRVQLNAHHLSDVAAGALVGLLVAWFVWRWIVQRGGLSRWLGPA